MKILLALFLFFSFSQCRLGKQPRKNHYFMVASKGHCDNYTNAMIKLVDSTHAAKLIEKYRHTPAHAATVAFAKSEVQMVAVKENFSDFTVYDYHYCEAFKTDTALVIRLEQYAPYESMILFEGNDLVFYVNKDDYKTEVVHFSDVKGIGQPKRGAYFDHLTLFTNQWEKGDTLCGRLNVRAYAPQKKRLLFQGDFKAVIQ